MFIKPDELCVGATLDYDVYSNNVLLVKKGTIVTEALKTTLSKQGVLVEVPHDIVPNRIPELTDNIYANLTKLDLDMIVDCAENLVSGLIDGEFHGMMHVVFDYDQYTYTHSKNVTLLALLAAIEMQYDIKDLHNIATGALLHDIGKLQIPLDVLDKPGKLTRDEYSIIQTHPYNGYAMLADRSGLSSAVKQIVLQHHENYDGSGYPNALDVKHGYRLARLIHICDVYEAMCARRPYKLPMSRSDVRSFMQSKQGSMFDPELTQKFLEAIPAYIIGEELDVCGIKCIVTRSYIGDDPVVQCGNDTLRLSTLRRSLGLSA